VAVSKRKPTATKASSKARPKKKGRR
jgi:hypothetical protein